MSLQSRRAGRCRCGGRCRWRCPTRNERFICSNSVGAGGFTTEGGRLCVSVTSRCDNFSTAGVGARDSTVASNHQSKSSS